ELAETGIHQHDGIGARGNVVIGRRFVRLLLTARGDKENAKEQTALHECLRCVGQDSNPAVFSPKAGLESCPTFYLLSRRIERMITSFTGTFSCPPCSPV